MTASFTSPENINNDNGLTFYISPQQLCNFEVKRLKMLAGGVCGCSLVAAAYAASIIFSALQHQFGITQDSLTTVSSVGFVFQFFTYPGGLLVDIAGPRVVLSISTIVTTLGWALFTLTFNGTISHNVAALTIFDVILAGTTGYTDPACNLNNLFQFSLNRGLVVLIQKTYMGLAVSLLSLTYISLFQNQNSDETNNSNNNSTSSSPSEEPHSVNGMIGYCSLFCGLMFFWGLVAFSVIREAPMMKLKRQKLYKKEGSFELLGEHDVALMERMETSSVHYLSASSSSALDTDHSDRNATNRQSPPPLSEALEAALSHHVPCDSRIVLTGQLMLLFNLIYLTGASIAMLYVSPSHNTALAVTIIAHLLTFDFFLLALLKKFVWKPTEGLLVVFPGIQHGDVFNNSRNEDEINNNGTPELADHNSSSLVSLRTCSDLAKRVTADADSTTTHEAFTLQQQQSKKNSNNKKDKDQEVRAPLVVQQPPPSFAPHEVHPASPFATGKQSPSDNVADKTSVQMLYPNMHRQRFLKALVSSVDLWLIFFSVCFVWGTGSVVISNTIQIYDCLAGGHHDDHPNANVTTTELPLTSSTTSIPSLEPVLFFDDNLIGDGEKKKEDGKHNSKKSKAASLTVSLMGAGSAIGRILVGWVDENFLSVRRLSVTVLFPLCPLLMALSYLIPFVQSSTSSVLWLPWFLNSCSYGASWGVILLGMRQMFAVDTAQCYMFLFASGASSLIFNRVIFGPLYDKEREAQGASAGHCVGVSCISTSLIVMTAACVVSVFLGTLMHYRWQARNGLSFFESLPLPTKNAEVSSNDEMNDSGDKASVNSAVEVDGGNLLHQN